MVQYLVITLSVTMEHMAYTTNPRIEQVRYEAYCLVHYHNWSTRQAARRLGYSQSAIVKWCSRKPVHGRYGRLCIPTESSRPHSHPRKLTEDIVSKILTLRQERRQCAEIIHYRLKKEGILVSLSSVKRTLKRAGCTRFSKWKKWHKYPARPLALKPGILVQIDTVLDGSDKERLYAYTLLDVFSRWAFSFPAKRINTHQSLSFVKQAQLFSPFGFNTLQSDHGPEFSKWFTKKIKEQGLLHRHSRIRTPSDNGHLERFNRTLQEECLQKIPRSFKSWKKEIPEYLNYYNTERPHMALNYQTPMGVITSY